MQIDRQTRQTDGKTDGQTNKYRTLQTHFLLDIRELPSSSHLATVMENTRITTKLAKTPILRTRSAPSHKTMRAYGRAYTMQEGVFVLCVLTAPDLPVYVSAFRQNSNWRDFDC